MTAVTMARFVVAAMLAALAPGPDILTVLGRSVTQGVRTGIVASLGFASGLTVHTTLAALGVAAILKAWPAGKWTVTCLGAAYLLYLAGSNLMSKGAFEMEAGGRKRGLWTVFGQSALMNILNPKVLFVFMAFLPKFIEPPTNAGSMPIWMQSVMFGCVFALCTIVVFGTCAVFAGGISGWLRRKPGSGKWLKWGTSALFVAIAILLGWIAAGFFVR